MAKEERFTFLSSDGKTQIQAVKWMPEDGTYSAILQITHGMIEFVERYKPFAEYLTEHGFLVVGHDHLGHGSSVQSKEDWGYFADENPSDTLIADMHKLRTMIQEENPSTPYFMLGHSMGSFFSRRYLTRFGDRLSGAILMGTGHYTLAEAEVGKLLSGALMVARGGFYRSCLLEKLTIGGYSKYFASEACKSWLTRDAEQAARYEADPFCSFTFTASAYYQLFSLLADLAKHKDFAKIPKRLPIVLLSGENDPVGKFGKGVKQVYRDLKKQGIRDVRMKLYPQARHELLNETNREEVYADILSWILRHASEGTKSE